MKLPLWTSTPIVNHRNKSCVTLLVGLMAGALPLFGQSVISPPTAVANTPPAFVQPTASDSTPSIPLENSPFQWGFVTAHPHLSYRFLYGNGLQFNPGSQTTTSINSISLGVLLNIGTHWTLDYTPTQTYYSDRAFKDTLDHAVRILGGTTYEDWNFQVSQTFASTDTPRIETGRQTSEKDYGTAITAGYHFSNQVQLDTNFGYQARFTSLFPDTHETTIGERLHYQFLPRVDTSVSLDYGSVNMSSGTDMTYTRPGVQLNWKATDKASFNVQAGFENRKFKTGAESLNTPTFGASFQLQPFTTTSIGLTANRGVSSSYFTNQITRNTGWGLDVRQRLLQHYYLSAGYTGQKSTYLSTDPLVVAGRDDRSTSFNLRLSTVFFQRATVALLYQSTHNSSNTTGFGFTSSQVGLELSYQF